MMTDTRRFTNVVGGYYVVAGVLMIVGWRTASWWTEVLGLAFLVMAVATVVGRAEWTTWFRGELDERRRSAMDHAFRIAFLVLAWWVGAVGIYASYNDASTALWTAGTAVAVAAAVVDYGLVLRRR